MRVATATILAAIFLMIGVMIGSNRANGETVRNPDKVLVKVMCDRATIDGIALALQDSQATFDEAVGQYESSGKCISLMARISLDVLESVRVGTDFDGDEFLIVLINDEGYWTIAWPGFNTTIRRSPKTVSI